MIFIPRNMKPTEETSVKENPIPYWFKRKIWGWTPATWQGWFVTGLYAVFIFTFLVIKEQPIAGDLDSGSNFLVLGLPITYYCANGAVYVYHV